ncbi:MAG TPA: hypothetical protein VK196_05740 [Magnetospirillum sp.]|nr:hypothetical protein [Magnetospirillum sp.]
MPLTVQTIMDALAGVAYATDLDGRILCIGQRGWRLFAVENGALGLANPDVFIGTNLFDALAGADVRMAYARLLERVRRGEPQITLPCRCDAPGVSRDMRMTITPLRRNRTVRGVLFQSITLAERTRPPIRLFEFADQGYPESVPLLGMCSLCERVCPPWADCEDQAAQWMEPERYYAEGGTSQVRISHTVCSGCFRHWVQGWTGMPPPEF